MTPRSRHALDSFTQQLHAWRPFASAKRPCRSDRSTAPDALDLTRLSLLDSPSTPTPTATPSFLRKRRRRPSRSLSARSSRATASDFPAAPNTDSSGEMFVNAGWGSDASEATTPALAPVAARGVERESAAPAEAAQGFDSGYGSEPGYRGDAEFGYGDEFDEEDDDGRVMFWGGGPDHMEIVGENTFAEQKTHPRCRRKKQEWRILSPLR